MTTKNECAAAPEAEHCPIDEIKWIRDRYGISLKESKDIYDGRAKQISTLIMAGLAKTGRSEWREKNSAEALMNWEWSRLSERLTAPCNPTTFCSTLAEDDYLSVRYGMVKPAASELRIRGEFHRRVVDLPKILEAYIGKLRERILDVDAGAARKHHVNQLLADIGKLVEGGD